jgi:hypothetical protein
MGDISKEMANKIYKQTKVKTLALNTVSMLREEEENGCNVSAALLGIKNPGYSLPPSTPTRHVPQ